MGFESDVVLGLAVARVLLVRELRGSEVLNRILRLFFGAVKQDYSDLSIVLDPPRCRNYLGD